MIWIPENMVISMVFLKIDECAIYRLKTQIEYSISDTINKHTKHLQLATVLSLWVAKRDWFVEYDD